MFLLALRNQNSTNADVLHALNSAINLLDDYVVIPSIDAHGYVTVLVNGLGFSSFIGDCEMDFSWAKCVLQFLRLNDWKLWKIRSITLMPEV